MSEKREELPSFADRPKRARGMEAAHRICLEIGSKFGYQVFRIATLAKGEEYLVFGIHPDDDQEAAEAYFLEISEQFEQETEENQ